MLRHIKAVALAFGLLTRIPIPSKCFTCTEKMASDLAVCYYPLTGLVIALLSSLVFILFPNSFSDFLSASALVVVIIILTGGIHLDGVSDSFDAMFAAHKSPERAFKVFKDPNTGALGVVSVVSVLLIKAAALESLIQLNQNIPLILIWVLVFSRLLCSLFIVVSNYASESSLDAGAHSHKYQKQIILIILLWITLSLMVLPWQWLLCLVFSNVLFFMYWQHLWAKLIGGYTGDNLGALVEISECLSFISIVIAIGLVQ